jgi:hypothetical protein
MARPSGQQADLLTNRRATIRPLFEVTNESATAINIAGEVVNAINDDIGKVDGKINRDC